MGYESRLFVVDKHESKGCLRPDLFWAEKIAEFNLSKVPEVSTLINSKYPFTDCYIYADDGNTAIVEDKYGSPLREIPLVDMVGILESCAKGSNYRRFNPCIQLLKGFDLLEWGNLVVLHYGY